MPRRKLTDAEKKSMRSARVSAREGKQQAMEALTGNLQFLNPTFWKGVDLKLSNAVAEAIARGQGAAKEAEIKKLEAQVAKLKAELD